MFLLDFSTTNNDNHHNEYLHTYIQTYTNYVLQSYPVSMMICIIRRMLLAGTYSIIIAWIPFCFLSFYREKKTSCLFIPLSSSYIQCLLYYLLLMIIIIPIINDCGFTIFRLLSPVHYWVVPLQHLYLIFGTYHN